jgi:hypothetical protein
MATGVGNVALDCPIDLGQYDNVSAPATDDPAAALSAPPGAGDVLDPRVLDVLVPPPPVAWKRALVWFGVLAVVGGVVWSVASGRTVPRADVFVSSWGGSGPVQVTVEVENRSPVAIEVVDGPAAPDGLRLLGRTTAPPDRAVLLERPPTAPVDAPAVRLDPGERVLLVSWFEVESCEQVERSRAPSVGVTVRIARGPARAVELTRTATIDGLPGGPSVAAAIAAGVCD